VNLSMSGAPGADVKSGALRARVVTESWGEHNLYCPNCTSPILVARDDVESGFECPRCGSGYRLKCQKTRIGHSFTDGPYTTLTRAIRRGDAPGYFVLHYEIVPPLGGENVRQIVDGAWVVRNLVLVPGAALATEAIVKGPDGVGCRIVLDSLPAAARIPIITTIKSSSAGDTECIMISRPEEVREKFRQFKK
jgi:uncharacterized C2H2 Zn-finger protein